MSENTDIPAPESPEENQQISELTLQSSWDLYDLHIIPPAYIPRQRLDIKKGFYSGGHSLLQAVELILQSCTTEEAERRIRSIKDNIEDEIRDLVQEDERLKLPVVCNYCGRMECECSDSDASADMGAKGRL